jgi:hypothetical protein
MRERKGRKEKGREREEREKKEKEEIFRKLGEFQKRINNSVLFLLEY